MSDQIDKATRFLTANLEWLRHAVRATEDGTEPYAVAAFDEIAQCAGRLRSLVDGPPPKMYLGPCGADTPPACKVCQATDLDHHRDCDVTCPHKFVPGPPCDGDAYGIRGASVGRCRTCGAEVAQDDRQAWLDGEVRAHAFTATEIGRAYSVNINTIRSWAARGQLAEHGRDRDDRPLYNVGDVLDLAAADAARRETERAKRERRAAARAADDERMSA